MRWETFVLIAAAVIVIGGYVLGRFRFWRRWMRKLGEIVAPLGESAESKPPYVAPFIAIWFIGLIAAVAFPSFYVWHGFATAGSEQWVTTTGRIEQRSSYGRTSRNGTSYRPEITYSYEVGGRTFRNDNIWLSAEKNFDREEVKVFLAGYPVGSAVEVSYAPDNPQRSALIMERRDVGWTLWVGGVGLVLAMFGWAFRYPAAYRRARRAKAGGDV